MSILGINLTLFNAELEPYVAMLTIDVKNVDPKNKKR